MSLKFEYIGGNIWSCLQEGRDGYDETIISLEIERGKIPYVIEMNRPMNKLEVDDIIKLVYNEYKA